MSLNSFLYTASSIALLTSADTEAKLLVQCTYKFVLTLAKDFFYFHL